MFGTKLIYYLRKGMSLFVGNISRSVRARDLEEEFGKFGRCDINHKVCSPTDWYSKGSYAFVEFKDEKEAEDALHELKGKNMGGLEIAVEWSKKSSRYDPKDAPRPPR